MKIVLEPDNGGRQVLLSLDGACGFVIRVNPILGSLAVVPLSLCLRVKLGVSEQLWQPKQPRNPSGQASAALIIGSGWAGRVHYPNNISL